MTVDIAVVLSSLAGLFLIMGTGMLAVRTKIISAEITPHLSNILIQIALPCTVFYSLAEKEYDPSFLEDSLITLGLGLTIIPACAMLAFFLAKYVFHVKKGGVGVWSMACTFCNNGFIGYPVIQSLFGTDGLALAVIYGLAVNLLTYSLGIWMISKDSAPADVTAQGYETPRMGLRTLLFNNVNIALVSGMIVYFAGFPLPEIIMIPVEHFGNMTTPLSMFTTGAIMASSSVGGMMKDTDVYKAGLTRLVLFPVLILLVLKRLPIANQLIVYVVAVTMMMPSPAISTILSELYHGNKDLASRIVLFSSFLCVATIPVMTMLL